MRRRSNIMPVHKENSRPDFYQKGAKKRIILQGFTHTQLNG